MSAKDQSISTTSLDKHYNVLSVHIFLISLLHSGSSCENLTHQLNCKSGDVMKNMEQNMENFRLCVLDSGEQLILIKADYKLYCQNGKSLLCVV